MEASQAERRSFIDLGRLQRAEYFGFLAAIVLAASLFLPWFSVDEQSNGSINGVQGDLNAWETYGVLDILLLAACTAPFILAYIIVRGHALSWRPGEVTAIVGLTALVLIFCNGIVFGKPGEPDSEISIGIGWLIGLIAAGGIAVSGFLRQLEGTGRKPPGV